MTRSATPMSTCMPCWRPTGCIGSAPNPASRFEWWRDPALEPGPHPICSAIWLRALLRRPCQRAVDHCDRIGHAIDRDERAETRALLLAEQHLVEHVEPVERDAGPTVLALLHGVEERFAAANFIDHVLDVFGTRARRQLRQRIAQILQRGALALGRLAELLRRRHEVAVVIDGVADHRVELRMGLRRHARTIAADEAPQRFGVL